MAEKNSFSPENIAAAAALDRAGFLPEDGEDCAAFEKRVQIALDSQKRFLDELAEKRELLVFDEIKVRAEARIPEGFVAEAGEITRALYGFCASHVPGFFLSRDVGALWGGCMISDPDLPLSIFLIRGAFRTRRRWLFYRRSELLAHELCHSMRQSLRDMELEEFFAYQTSPSPLRRYLGNCFIRSMDAVLFVLPTLLLLGAQLVQSFLWERLPVEPFWILALAYPAFLLIRNQRARNRIFRAERNLKRWEIPEPMAFLFRCTFAEIREIGQLKNPDDFLRMLAEKAQHSLRWSILQVRSRKNANEG